MPWVHHQSPANTMKHVAIIGAGAAGLAALRRLASKPSNFSAVAYERTDNVGGTWVYTDQTGTDEEGVPIHSSMYRNLKTNLPKEVMAFQGFPFDTNLPSFMVHEDVNKYLNLFADEFDLRKFIEFKTSVLRVHPVHKDTGLVWEVTTKKRPEKDSAAKTEVFDAVIVCNGHYSIPLVPNLPGMDTFTGEVLHSHNYRHPENYSNKAVLCLGSGSSGQDICLDLAPHVKHLYLCSWRPALNSVLPSNISQKPAIRCIQGDSVILENGEEIKVDVLLLCTGYKYTFPFLTPECGMSTEGERVHPVYKHILHPRLPSLSFIGLCKTVCPFPHFDLQVRFAIAALDGSMKLPTAEGMEADIEEDYQSRLARGMPHRYAHHLADAQWQYNDMIADLAGIERLIPVVNKLYSHVHAIRRRALPVYKKFNYRLEDSERFTEITIS